LNEIIGVLLNSFWKMQAKKYGMSQNKKKKIVGDVEVFLHLLMAYE